MMTEREAAKLRKDHYLRNRAHSAMQIYSHFDMLVSRACSEGHNSMIATWADFNIQHDDIYASWDAAREELVDCILDNGYAVDFAWFDPKTGLRSYAPVGLIVCWGDDKDKQLFEISKEVN